MTDTSQSKGLLGCVTFEGWDYRELPPKQIKDPSYLNHTNPWFVFCSILERAKLGDFSEIDRLTGLCHSADVDLRFASEYLLASIAPNPALEVFDHQILDADTSWRMESADHAALCGSLRLVDTFIAGYRLAFGETTRAAMEDGLANLLVNEPESRLITDCLMATDREQGEARLRKLATQKSNEFGPTVSLHNGVPLTLRAITDEIDVTLGEGDPCESFAHLQSLVTRLQTMVGFSQVGMFTESDDAWDEPLIREQLTKASDLNHEAGMRVFFGHPAPL